jgi:pyruvate dehydrogenase E1 component alpha subunit
MWQVAGQAIARARKGDGPTLIEAKTFRFHGHIFGDADAYMDPAEKAAAIERDPLPRMRAWLIACDHASESQIQGIEKAIKQEIDEAVEFALSSPYPDLAELRRDVYAEEIPA